MTKKIINYGILCGLLLGLFSFKPALAQNPPILITEVQPGFIDSSGLEFPKQEFVEIANVSSAAVNLAGWRLEYLSAANNGTGAPTQTISNLSGYISMTGYGIWEHDGYFPVTADGVFGVGDTSSSGFLAKTGGHVRLMNGTTMIDCVSWGSAVTIAGCDKVTSAPGPGYSIQRSLTSSNLYDKGLGVSNISPSTPRGGNISATSPTTPDDGVVIPAPPNPSCDTVELSEILANPAGDDAAGEFIEVHNPASIYQSLYGCGLKLSNGKQYDFSDNASLAPDEYKAIYYVTSGLQLANSGGTVTLTTTSREFSATYPAVGDNEAWAQIDGKWQITKLPTPDQANRLAVVATDIVTTTALDDLQVCPEGKERNPDTGRCRNIVQPTNPVACAVGQERNPATGRCRKVATTVVPAVCQAGQERNPDTGRCRKVNEPSTTQKPCDPGQERNPDTGRCRKITPPSSGKVLSATTSKKTYHYWLLGIVLLAVMGYAIYEYRHDIANLKQRFRRT